MNRASVLSFLLRVRRRVLAAGGDEALAVALVLEHPVDLPTTVLALLLRRGEQLDDAVGQNERLAERDLIRPRRDTAEIELAEAAVRAAGVAERPGERRVIARGGVGAMQGRLQRPC